MKLDLGDLLCSGTLGAPETDQFGFEHPGSTFRKKTGLETLFIMAHVDSLVNRSSLHVVKTLVEYSAGELFGLGRRGRNAP